MIPQDTDAYTVEILDSREAWEASRSDAIGASEAGVLWGVSAYDSIFSLYDKKVGRAPVERDEAEWLEWGHDVEPAIARAAARKTGRRLEDWGSFTRLRSRRWPWLTCTLDRVQFVEDRPGPGSLDCKNRAAWSARTEWAEGVPLDVICQMQQQMAVTGWSWASVAVSKGGVSPEVIDVDRDDEFIEMHAEKARDFWELVTTRTYPRVDGSEHTALALRRIVGELEREGRLEVALPELAQEAADAVLKLRTVEKQAEDARREAENHLLMALAVAGVARGRLPSGGLVTAKLINRRAYVANVAASSYLRLDVKPPKVDRRALDNKSLPLLEAAQEE